MNTLTKYFFSTFIFIFTLSDAGASDLLPTIPTPVYFQNNGELTTADGVLITFDSVVIDNSTRSFFTERLSPATYTSVSAQSVHIHFCDLTNGKNCSPSGLDIKQFGSAPNLTGDLDEYLISTLLNPSSNEIAGLSISARSVAGYNYALDWIINSIDKKASVLTAVEVHDYPAFTERSLHTTDTSADLNRWKQYIDAAATLRIRELTISWLKNRKVTVMSPELSTYKPELFSTISPFIGDTNLMNSIISYGKKRGVTIIPSLPHFSSFQLYNYYPDWTTPNGRAIDWRKPEPRSFLDAMVSSAMRIDSVESISVWADEGGVTDRQVDFISQLTETVERVRSEIGRNIRLRFMLTPIVSSAIKSGAINDLTSLLPTNTIIDIYAGAGSDSNPGTYHLVSPTLASSVVKHIQKGAVDTDISGVGFVKRSRFNDVSFPTTSYFDKFLLTIQENGGLGNFMYMGPSYDSIFETPTEYLSHRLWSGLTQPSSKLLSTLPDQGWFNTVPEVSESWETLMITALSNHFQTIKVRMDGTLSEPVRNYEKFKQEVASGLNQQRINAINAALLNVSNTLNANDLHGVSATSMRNIEITQLIAKQIMLIRKIAEHDVSLAQSESVTLDNLHVIAETTETFLENCGSLNRFTHIWTAARHIPICTYLSIIYDVRTRYGLPIGKSVAKLRVADSRDFKKEYKQRIQNDLRLMDYVELPTVNSKEYGYGSFDREHPEAVAFTFSADASNSVELFFEVFDIDSENELSLYVNGMHLASNENTFRTENQQWGIQQRMAIPSSALSNTSVNLIEFRNESGYGLLKRKFVWGVRGVKVVQK